ncbi:MAG TPA: GIY-YIG nuclease family protein [Ktedonosporobacter sp.]|nr:GIY-YIG nuclease family protein [Ktedonosporobacter sp.]
MSGRTIRIYLVDGTAIGVRTAELINWTGVAVVGQRTQLGSLAQRPEAQKTGVYILVGPDPEMQSKERIYIGEGDNVLERLVKHAKDGSKDFWTQVIFFISKDENLTKAHVRYLERELIQLAKATGRVILANTAYPDKRPLPEAEVADMQFFLEHIQLLLPVLGFNFLQPLPQTGQLTNAPEGEGVSPLLEMSISGAKALAREYKGDFIVLKGSTAHKDPKPYWTSYRQLREQLVQEKLLIPSEDGKFYLFQEDIPFKSPSAAAAVIHAGNQNGRLAWKVKDRNMTYKEWQETQLREAGVDETH